MGKILQYALTFRQAGKIKVLVAEKTKDEMYFAKPLYNLNEAKSYMYDPKTGVLREILSQWLVSDMSMYEVCKSQPMGMEIKRIAK